MRAALAAAALVAFAGCASEGPPRTFDNNAIEIATGAAAHGGCSCVFVMGMPESYCQEWTRISPPIVRFSVDYVTKRVEASAWITTTASARYVDDKLGCVLE